MVEGSWDGVVCGGASVVGDAETVLVTVLGDDVEVGLDEAGTELGVGSSMRKATELKGEPKFVPFTM
jgi:hypothetical protein